jgi:hypothetical protein
MYNKTIKTIKKKKIPNTEKGSWSGSSGRGPALSMRR